VYDMSSNILGEFMRGLRWVKVGGGGGYQGLRGPRFVSCARTKSRKRELSPPSARACRAHQN